MSEGEEVLDEGGVSNKEGNVMEGVINTSFFEGCPEGKGDKLVIPEIDEELEAASTSFEGI